MKESMMGRIGRYFLPHVSRDGVAVASPSASFPNILKTGSMLHLGADLLEDVPLRLGPYRILEQIGEGGMGVVYLAEQDPPLARRVAVKLARSSVPGDRALARFESERQTLAVMNHPNIARVFDAGSAPDSRPYFVMEHVAGESITDFCDAHELGIEARLELFVRVCEGVQHAHVNAVIHRDLKPSNILVTSVAGAPTPKIIDFGLAKAFESGPGPEPGLTQFGQIIGTPEYMSPEQAALDGRPVDTRTDVYSLGVVLYELLAGSRPFERDTGPDTTLVDLCQRIREEDPERPSARVARTSDVESARRRGFVPHALARRLRGDLDAIAIKALAKDPAGRYATPSDMAADVGRFLQHRPISARAPGPVGRLRKVVRRHRTATAVIAALSATLLGLAVIGMVQAVRAQRASARAAAEAQVASKVSKFVVGVIDPSNFNLHSDWPVNLADLPTRQTLLSQIRTQFADLPLLQAQLLLAAGNHLTAVLGTGHELEMLIEQRDKIMSLRGPDSLEALEANETIARSYINFFRYQEAEALLLDVRDRRRSLAGSDHPDFWRTTAQLAFDYKSWGKHDRAAPLYEDAIEGLERQLGPDDRDVLEAKVGLSGSYLELGRYAEAQALLEPVVDPIRRVFGERVNETWIALYNLAIARANLGDADGAFRYLRESIDLGWNYPGSLSRDPLLLPLHGDPRFDALERTAVLNDEEAWSYWQLEARARLREGRVADAERLLRDLIAAVKRNDPNGSANRVPTCALARCWIRHGRFDDAERLLLQTLSAVRAEHAGGPQVLELLAQCDIGRGRIESALARIAEAAALRNHVYDSAERLYAEAENDTLRGRKDEALRSLARAVELGFDNIDRLEEDLAFQKLRSRGDFVAIAKSVRRRALESCRFLVWDSGQ